MRTEIYRDRDGYRDYLKFMADWMFATELFEYVEKTYGESRWAIDICAQTGPGTFSASFRPYYGGKGSLHICVTYHEDSETGWDFCPS